VLGFSRGLPSDYRLELEADVLVLLRADTSVVGRFSTRGATEEAVMRTAKDDHSNLPLYSGPEEHAESVRRMVRLRMERPWQRFLRTEQRMLEARKKGQLAKALVQSLPCESHEELEEMVKEDCRQAQQGLLELRSESGEISYKHIDQLSSKNRTDRIRAELARIEWLLERQGRRNIILRGAFFEPRRSLNEAETAQHTHASFTEGSKAGL
jgi:hypothetical protein